MTDDGKVSIKSGVKFPFVYDAGIQRRFIERLDDGDSKGAYRIIRGLPPASNDREKIERLIVQNVAYSALLERVYSTDDDFAWDPIHGEKPRDYSEAMDALQRVIREMEDYKTRLDSVSGIEEALRGI